MALIQWTLKDICRALESAQANEFDNIIVIEGNRGCLTKDTIVQTNQGLKKIEDIPEISSLKAYDFENKKVVEAQAKKINSGRKVVFRIETDDGRIIDASEDHIFFVKRDGKIKEVQLKDLNEGDKLICIS